MEKLGKRLIEIQEQIETIEDRKIELINEKDKLKEKLDELKIKSRYNRCNFLSGYYTYKEKNELYAIRIIGKPYIGKYDDIYIPVEYICINDDKTECTYCKNTDSIFYYDFAEFNDGFVIKDLKESTKEEFESIKSELIKIVE